MIFILAFILILGGSISYHVLKAPQEKQNHAQPQTEQTSPSEIKEYYYLKAPEIAPNYAQKIDRYLKQYYPESAEDRRQLLRSYLLTPPVDTYEITGDLKAQISKKYWIDRLAKRHNLETRIFANTLYGLPHHGVLMERPNHQASGLLIYSQGHKGNGFDKDYIDDFVTLALEQDMDILFLSMTSFGINQYPPTPIPGRLSEITVSPRSHNSFALFYDKENPSLTGNALFISGNYYLIQHVRNQKNYQKTIATGISGGGWFATVLAALDTSINKSASFAGTIPMAFRGMRRNLGDYEQSQDAMYKTFDYWDLYVLATLDAKGQPTRNHVQFYNSDDECCFNGKTAEKLIQIYEGITPIQGLRFDIIEEKRHKPNAKALKDFIRD